MNAFFIVETRHLPNLKKVITNHCRFLPNDWELFIFGSERNKYLKDKFECTFEIVHDIYTAGQYNSLLTQPSFWEKFDDKVLCFQHDSGILREGIDEFLEWDYVGAPRILAERTTFWRQWRVFATRCKKMFKFV